MKILGKEAPLDNLSHNSEFRTCSKQNLGKSPVTVAWLWAIQNSKTEKNKKKSPVNTRRNTVHFVLPCPKRGEKGKEITAPQVLFGYWLVILDMLILCLLDYSSCLSWPVCKNLSLVQELLLQEVENKLVALKSLTRDWSSHIQKIHEVHCSYVYTETIENTSSLWKFLER